MQHILQSSCMPRFLLMLWFFWFFFLNALIFLMPWLKSHCSSSKSSSNLSRSVSVSLSLSEKSPSGAGAPFMFISFSKWPLIKYFPLFQIFLIDYFSSLVLLPGPAPWQPTSWPPAGLSGAEPTRTRATTPRDIFPVIMRRFRCCSLTDSWASSWFQHR